MNPVFGVFARRTILVASAAVLISACTSGGGARISDAALSGDPTAMWEDGQKTVATGEALVSKGEKRLKDGRKDVREGEAKISKGNQQVLQAKQDYIAAVGGVGGATSPKDVDAEAKRLRTVGKRWEDAIDEIKDGNKLVGDGNKTIDRGQSEIREGRGLMESGSTLMRNSQRSRLGDKMLPVPTTDQ